jgi:hypothetical protein
MEPGISVKLYEAYKVLFGLLPEMHRRTNEDIFASRMLLKLCPAETKDELTHDLSAALVTARREREEARALLKRYAANRADSDIREWMERTKNG